MSKRTPRRRTKRRISWPSWLLLFVGLCVAAGDRGRAENPHEFVLNAKADRVQGIAARHGLTVVRSLDDHEHGVYLVRGVANGAPEQLAAQVSADPEVNHFEINGVALASEVPSGISLNHSPLEILDSPTDRTIVQYLRPTGVVTVRQPARHAGAFDWPSAHATVTGAGIVAIIDTGVDPKHPMLAGVLVPGYDFVNDTAGQASEWNDLDPNTTAVLNSQSPAGDPGLGVGAHSRESIHGRRF